MTPPADMAMKSPLAAGYAPQAHVWDALCPMAGEIRPAWEPFTKRLMSLGLDEVIRRWKRAQHLMRESGGMSAPDAHTDSKQSWHLDPLPHLIAQDDWQLLERAIVQRATLLNAVLADVYGQQQLLRQGILPTELVFGHPGFLRPCHGLQVHDGKYLHVYAMDVARNAQGEWIVLNEHTQAPSGMGYAAENRITMMRMFPELYRDSSVQNIQPFFNQMREMLRSMSPREFDNPRMVLLTPGSYSKSYFEHVYLARHLGLHLVEGSDLSVRDNGVSLKTLGGLMPVDVILRRTADSMCDALELRYDSLLGVPGLVQCAHAGKVSVANALGTGLLDTPIFIPYLPALAETILGEQLNLPSVETHWCREAESMRAVQANPEEFLFRSSYEGNHTRPIDAGQLDVAARQDFLRRLQDDPAAFVAQRNVPLSTTPTLHDDKLTPCPVILRFYAVATQNGYRVMPGGLAHVGSDVRAPMADINQSVISKDVWVLSDEPDSSPTVLRQMRVSTPLKRTGMDMPSRVADNLFWLGRYTERAEGAIRLLRAILWRLTDEMGLADPPELGALLSLIESNGLFGDPPEKSPSKAKSRHDIEALLMRALFADDCPGNMYDVLRALCRNMRTIRDRISVDAWRSLSKLDKMYPEPESGLTYTPGEALALLDELIVPLSSFSGFAQESMTRGPGWRFMDIGRRLERAQYNTLMLRELVMDRGHREPYVLRALLEIGDCSMTYRSRYLSSLYLAAVVDLLLMDETSPRSAVFQLRALGNHIATLSGDPSQAELAPESRLILGCLNTVRLAEVITLCEANKNGDRPLLATLLARLEADLPRISDTLASRYFSHSEMTRPLLES